MEDIWADFEASREPPMKAPTFVNKSICCGTYKVPGCDNLPVCTRCGRIDQSYIDNTPEWSNNVSEEGKSSDNSRAGNLAVDTELYSHEWGRSTVIRAGWNSSYKMKRMARINFYQSMNSKDRRLFHSYDTIERVANQKLNLPTDIIKNAKVMYKKFSEGDVLTRGKNRQGIMANCIYFACKLSKLPRTIDEIAEAYGVDRKYISKMEETFLDVMGIRVQEETCASASIAQRMLNEFQIERVNRMAVVKACHKLSECSKLMSKQPKTIAATAIIVVLDIPRSDVCKTCQVSLATVSKLESVVRDYLK